MVLCLFCFALSTILVLRFFLLLFFIFAFVPEKRVLFTVLGGSVTCFFLFCICRQFSILFLPLFLKEGPIGRAGVGRSGEIIHDVAADVLVPAILSGPDNQHTLGYRKILLWVLSQIFLGVTIYICWEVRKKNLGKKSKKKFSG